MNQKEALKKLHQGINQNKKKLQNERKIKEYKSDYYSMNSIFGNDWAMFYVLLGGRCCGKSYAALEWCISRKQRKQELTKLFWMRLTDNQADELVRSDGEGLVDPALKRKYNINLRRKGRKLYNDGKEFCEVLSCSTFYSQKGVASYDQDFEKQNGSEYIFILDEFEKEDNEKSQGDILRQFTNAIHNKCRNAKNVKVIMIGNTLSETSDILAAFNFIPLEWGRYKLKRQRCVVDYIKPTEKYIEQQKGSVQSYLQKDSSSFTNVNDDNMLDASLIVNKRECHKPAQVIMFKKSKNSWYTMWNNMIIKRYNNEDVPRVPMNRYLNAVYNQEARNAVLDMFDAQAFKFVNLATFLTFQTELKQIRKK